MIKDSYGNTRFFGVYRGVVFDVADPLAHSRLRVKVPQVLADTPTQWAWPIGVVGSTLPVVGAGVWVQFEGGDPSYPIWSGAFSDNLVAASSATTASVTSTDIVVALDSTATGLPVSSGGTGISTYAVGDLLYAGTTSTLARLADIATGNVLLSGGVTTSPSYGKVGLTTHVSGTLPVGSGGTNITTYAVGDLLVGGATNTLNKVSAVASGNVLLSNGVTTSPVWGKVDLTTSTGDVSGILSVANGGTGAATFTSGSYLQGAGTAAITAQVGIPAGDITSGALGIARGGTGVTTGAGLVPVIPSSVSATSGTASVNAAGLVTFTSAQNISFNGCFSATYRNYRITFDISATTAATQVGIRFRVGTTDNSSATYYQYWVLSRLGGTVQSNNGGPSTLTNLFSAGGVTTGWWGTWTGDVTTPFVTTHQTIMSGQGMGGDSTDSWQINSSSLFNSTTSFDGFTLIGSAAVITGTLKVYGYN